MLSDLALFQTLLQNPLIQIVLPVSLVGGLAAIIGFFTARWLYRHEAAMRVNILQHEIVRLRRKVSQQESVSQSGDRTYQRLRRKLRFGKDAS